MHIQKACKLCFGFIFGAMLLASCGHEPSTQLTSESINRKTLFIVMGGNTTCKEGPDRLWTPLLSTLATKFFKVRKDLQDRVGLRSDYLVSCYSPLDFLAFKSNKAGQSVRFGSSNTYIKQAKELIESESRPVIIIGHSYGGWLAMKTVLALKPSVSLRGLVTIDPISRVHCKYTQPEGCMQAPQDFTRSEKQMIQKRTRYWGNFFQTMTPYLHASAIDEADENIQVNTSHSAIDSNVEVWEQIQNKTIPDATRRT